MSRVAQGKGGKNASRGHEGLCRSERGVKRYSRLLVGGQVSFGKYGKTHASAVLHAYLRTRRHRSGCSLWLHLNDSFSALGLGLAQQNLRFRCFLRASKM